MTIEVEALLREALAPVEPPAALANKLESALVNLTEFAQEELDSLELSAMRDPRNWVRPAAAVVITVTAGSALVALRVRSSHRARVARSSSLRQLAGRTLQDIAEETRRLRPDH
jgi:hypothetical protein